MALLGWTFVLLCTLYFYIQKAPFSNSDRKKIRRLICLANASILLIILSRYVGRLPEQASPFIKTIHSLNWAGIDEAIEKKDISKYVPLAHDFLLKLLPYIVSEPTVPINDLCHAPRPQLTYNSKSIPNNCKPVEKPKKVGVFIKLGFDVDALEILLNELSPVVNCFFIVESTFVPFSTFPKPLVWEHIQTQKRFSRFLKQIVHLVLDLSDIALTGNSKFDITDNPRHSIETQEGKAIWKKFRKWNALTGDYFTKNDILGFVNANEIVNADVVNYLKRCELPNDPTGVGLWAPSGEDKILKSVSANYPTFYSVSKAYEVSTRRGYPKREHYKILPFGGVTLKHYMHIPLQLAKMFTRSTKSVIDGSKMIPRLKALTRKELKEIENDFWNHAEGERQRRGLLKWQNSELGDTNFKTVRLPWFYQCNKERYPLWQGKHDDRID